MSNDNTTTKTAPKGDIDTTKATAIAYGKTVTKAKPTGDAEAMATFQTAFRAFHPGHRPGVMGEVTMALIGDGAKPEAIGAVTKAMTDLPTTASRVAKATLTDDEATVIRNTYMDTFTGATGSDIVPEGADGDAAKVYNDRIRAAVKKAIEGVTTGSRGDVKSFDDTLLAMVKDGIIADGAVLSSTYKGTKHTVTVSVVTKDGEDAVDVVDDKGRHFNALSPAYKKNTGMGNNGWDYYRTEDGTVIGSLRRS